MAFYDLRGFKKTSFFYLFLFFFNFTEAFELSVYSGPFGFCAKREIFFYFCSSVGTRAARIVCFQLLRTPQPE